MEEGDGSMAGREEVEKEKESVIQKRRSLHSGHVWRRHTLYGAITYALLSWQRGEGGGGSFTLLYSAPRIGREKMGRRGEGKAVCTRSLGDMIFQFGQKMKRTSVSFFTETIINRNVMEIIWLPKYLPLIL